MALADVQDRVLALENRIAILEAKEKVARAMYRWARQIDKVEMTSDPADVRFMCEHLLAKGGVMEMETVGFGNWGPSHDDIVEKFLGFAKDIDWAYRGGPHRLGR